MSDLNKYDAWLADDGPAALVIREHLAPVEGGDGVFFPATFASGENFPGGYNIDPPEGDKNVCLVDSVGSQANRIEPIFAKPQYAGLVPQVTIQAGPKEVNLLEAGHRAGDAIVRCSPLHKQVQDCFKAIQQGDAEPMAKIAPTSLVFGVWDSRDTQVKLPRLIASTIRAFDVKRLKRGAQFVPATTYVEDGLLEDTADKKTKDSYAAQGFIHVPAAGVHGGVIATSGIRRDATLSLVALRMLTAGKDEKKTLALRRYILGLALTAFTAATTAYLRQGCMLVGNLDKPRAFDEVFNDGRRIPATVTHEEAKSFAEAAAKAFGVGESKTVNFDKELAKRDVTGNADPATGEVTGRRRARRS